VGSWAMRLGLLEIQIKMSADAVLRMVVAMVEIPWSSWDEVQLTDQCAGPLRPRNP
jgi:hypothetical protein